MNHTVPLSISTEKGIVRLGDAHITTHLHTDETGTVECVVDDVRFMFLHPDIVEVVKKLKDWDPEIVSIPSVEEFTE